MNWKFLLLKSVTKSDNEVAVEEGVEPLNPSSETSPTMSSLPKHLHFNHSHNAVHGPASNHRSDISDKQGSHHPHPRSNSVTIRRPRKTVCDQCDVDSRNIYSAVTHSTRYSRRRSYTLSGGTTFTGWINAKRR